MVTSAGVAIAKLCKERGMSYGKLAKLSGVPASTIKNIVSGVSQNPGVYTIKKIVQVFGLSLHDFFEE